MKKTNISVVKVLALIFCLVISSVVVGQSKKDKKSGKAKKSKTETTVTTTKVEAAPAAAPTHESEVKKIVKTESGGIIRGYDFGTAKQKIKETEDAQYIADGKDFMIYNLTLNDREKAEIIYYFDEVDKLKGVGIAFMVSPGLMAENIEATMVDDFQNYFNSKYGKFTANDKGDEVWNAPDGSYTIEMGDSSEDPNNIEVEIEIFKKK